MKLFLSFLFFFLMSPSFAQTYQCEMPGLTIYDSPWLPNSDFLTLEFKGPQAHSIFPHLGPSDSEFFSVVLHKDWCQLLQGAILCETPKSALAELFIGKDKNSPLIQTTLRYFIFVLHYKETGWAFLKVRAQRMDDHPPVTYHTEFPEDSCKTEN